MPAIYFISFVSFTLVKRMSIFSFSCICTCYDQWSPTVRSSFVKFFLMTPRVSVPVEPPSPYFCGKRFSRIKFFHEPADLTRTRLRVPPCNLGIEFPELLHEFAGFLRPVFRCFARHHRGCQFRTCYQAQTLHEDSFPHSHLTVGQLRDVTVLIQEQPSQTVATSACTLQLQLIDKIVIDIKTSPCCH